MTQLKTTEDIKKLGTIMGVWAHPDDDTYSMGGIMAAAVQNGQTVVIVTATRGEAGVQDEKRWPAAELSKIRTEEMAAALNILGVKHHYWLDYPDGGCKNADQHKATDKIAEIIAAYKPDTILTFGPEGMTGHDDHKTVSVWANLAALKAGSNIKIYYAINTQEQYRALVEADKQFNIFFNINEPPVCRSGECAVHFELTEDQYKLKLAALHAMPSQTEALLSVFKESMRASLGVEAFTICRAK